MAAIRRGEGQQVECSRAFGRGLSPAAERGHLRAEQCVLDELTAEQHQVAQEGLIASLLRIWNVSPRLHQELGAMIVRARRFDECRENVGGADAVDSSTPTRVHAGCKRQRAHSGMLHFDVPGSRDALAGAKVVRQTYEV